jgi:hypothetical protein
MSYLTSLVVDAVASLVISVSAALTPIVIPSPTTGPAQNVPTQTTPTPTQK